MFSPSFLCSEPPFLSKTPLSFPDSSSSYSSSSPPSTCLSSLPLRFSASSAKLTSGTATAPSNLPFFLSFAASSTMSARNGDDPRIHDIKTKIRVVPNFPKPGIMFQDITTLLLDHKAFKNTIDLFVERYKDKSISVVAGIEARGFIFGPPIALAIGAKFVPLRKPRKLPGEVISEEYVLEYGSDCLEMHVGAVEPGERALVVDDLVATGGTLCAAMSLLERAGAEVVECACVIELPDLKGRERLKGKPLYILVEAH
ncbi:Adenine phosphoribosyltransferase 3 [Ancistrocladus abbreviatus]